MDVRLRHVIKDDWLYSGKIRFRLYFTIPRGSEADVQSLFHEDARLSYVGGWHSVEPLLYSTRLHWSTYSEEAVVEYTLRYHNGD